MPTFSVARRRPRRGRRAAPARRPIVSRQDYRATDGTPLSSWSSSTIARPTERRDAVAAAAAEHGIAAVTRVVMRRGEGLPDGKGAALTAAQPDTCTGDVVLVLDADARLEPWFLRRAAGYFAAGANAVTARRRILDAASSWLAGAQADEQTLDGEVNRGRWALGGCSEFRGNGIMIRRDLLAAVGGWRAAALTEDIDLSSRIAARAGERVAWAHRRGGMGRAGPHDRAALAAAAAVGGGRLPAGLRAGPRRGDEFEAPRSGAGSISSHMSASSRCRRSLLGAAAAAVATGRRRSVLSMLAGYLGFRPC